VLVGYIYLCGVEGEKMKRYYLRYDQAERAKALGLPVKTEKREYHGSEASEGTIRAVAERPGGRSYRELPPQVALLDYLKRKDYIEFVEKTENLFFAIEERLFPFSEETTWLDSENQAVFREDLVFLRHPEKPSSYIRRLRQLLEEKRKADAESAKWYE